MDKSNTTGSTSTPKGKVDKSTTIASKSTQQSNIGNIKREAV